MTPEECRERLATTRKALTDALSSQGNEKSYWANMKAWFKLRMTKEEFDVEARRLLTPETTHLHNEFLLAVLTKCHMVATVQNNKEASNQLSLKAKRNKRRMQAVKRKFDNRFIPAQATSLPPTRSLQQETRQLNLKKSQKQKETRFPRHIVFCARSLEIPGMIEMNGRVAVITWEKGLDDFADEVSQIVIKAIHVFLKNIIADVCATRSAYKLHSGHFKHSIGCTADNPYLLQKSAGSTLFGPRKPSGMFDRSKPTFDEAEQMAIESLGRATQELEPAKQPADMYSLLAALQKNKLLIPSHSVYSLSMERIISSLWHPDLQELEQDEKFRKLAGNAGAGMAEV